MLIPYGILDPKAYGNFYSKAPEKELRYSDIPWLDIAPELSNTHLIHGYAS